MPLSRIRPEDKSQEWRPRKSVRLYLDHLDEILTVMRQVDNEVRVRTAEHAGSISKAEELREVGSGGLSPFELEAGSEERGIYVRLSWPVTVRITRRDDLHLAGAGQAIHDLLARRHTRAGGWDRKIGPPPSLVFAALAVWLGVALSLFNWMIRLRQKGLVEEQTAREVLERLPIRDQAPLLVLFLMPILIASCFVLYKMFFGTNPAPSATIVLAYQADAPTWWERHRTSVLIGLATNVVVGAGFFLLGLWLG